MDANSHSFHVANPSTTYSPTVIHGNIENTGDIGNGAIYMTSNNDAKAGDLSLAVNGGGGKKKGGAEEGMGGGMPEMPSMPEF